MIKLYIEGNPRPAPRPRAARNGHVYMPKWYMDLKYAIELEAQSQMNLHEYEPLNDSRVAARLNFYRASHEKADIDNLSKTVFDALNGIAYSDDAQVDELHATVTRGVGKASAGVMVELWECGKQQRRVVGWKQQRAAGAIRRLSEWRG